MFVYTFYAENPALKRICTKLVEVSIILESILSKLSLPFSIFGVSSASSGLFPPSCKCRLCSLGVDSFSASIGLAAAIVNFNERISKVTALLWCPFELLTTSSEQEFGILLFSSCCKENNYGECATQYFHYFLPNRMQTQ